MYKICWFNNRIILLTIEVIVLFYPFGFFIMIFDFSLDTQSIKWKIDWPRIILYYISYIMKMKIIYFCSINLVKISIRTLDITYKSQYSTICHQNCYSNLQNTQKASLQLINFITIYSKRSPRMTILHIVACTSTAT